MDGKNSVLIVDDSMISRMKLVRILRDDYVLHTSGDGRSALLAANELQPDLILLDVIMPDMNGYEVLAELRKNEATKAIPVIFITGATNNDDEIKGLMSGAVDYIHKPLNDMIVMLRVRQQIQLLNQMREIENLSMRDQLTGLPNRRSFEMRIQDEWKRALREKMPFSLLLIDVDNFKNYNDTYGHQQGDAALRAVAGVFGQAMKRSSDFSARWGGEEFIVLLCSTDSCGAMGVAEQIRKLVETLEIPGPDGFVTRVTASIGVCTRAADDGGTVNELISKADRALYDAKQKGRNRVCCFE